MEILLTSASSKPWVRSMRMSEMVVDRAPLWPEKATDPAKEMLLLVESSATAGNLSVPSGLELAPPSGTMEPLAMLPVM